MSSVSVFSFMCFLSVLRCSYEYSMGAPDAACADMVPGHGPSSQSSASPYDLSVDVAEVANGDKIDVVIHGSKPFMGFFLQARNVSDENDITGSFIVKDDTEMGFLICNQGYSGESKVEAIASTSEANFRPPASNEHHRPDWSEP
ncbi:unnamed protein product [Cyprideis torosa]|uniref:Reelin domain-containing protein n=1 Tax=Cyprideis torosa TaxID=163714 RepID=A0A7R8WF76_9CRUS|nr:unnamed protein product [Cyprideis torosa]CAG0896674.1 unnamed protein product [Cyprideis torosa]